MVKEMKKLTRTTKKLNSDQKGCIPSYADNTRTLKLRKLLNNKQELNRLNRYRGTNWSQEELNTIIIAAILMRKGIFDPGVDWYYEDE
jgi:hypothetical protein